MPVASRNHPSAHPLLLERVFLFAAVNDDTEHRELAVRVAGKGGIMPKRLSPDIASNIAAIPESLFY